MYNKWQNCIKESNPDFYDAIINLMPTVPDFRPENTIKHMKQEEWDPWHRLYDEFSALGINNNDSERHHEIIKLLLGQKKLKNMNWIDMVDDTVREFVITYPVLTYLIEKISDPINLEGMWVALNKFDKLKKPQSKLTTLEFFAGKDKAIRNKLYDLYPKGWAWIEFEKTSWFNFLPVNIMMHLNCGGKSYLNEQGFKNDYFIDHYIEFQPCYWTIYDGGFVQVDIEKLEKIAISTTLPHREIICKRLGKHYGYPKKEWYNKENKTLPPIKSRPWIIVNKPYEVVRLDSAIKDQPLTIEDIFFAGRALYSEESYTYEEFSVIEDNGGILMLSIN